jgi:hypothetical protein
MCDTVFTLQTLLYRHFDQHIENQKVSVFKCPDCSLLYAQKQLMMDHIKVCVHLSSPLSELQIKLVISQGRAAAGCRAWCAVQGRDGCWSLSMSNLDTVLMCSLGYGMLICLLQRLMKRNKCML